MALPPGSVGAATATPPGKPAVDVLQVAGTDPAGLDAVADVAAQAAGDPDDFGLVVLKADNGGAVVADVSMAAERDPRGRAMWAAARNGVTLSWGSVAGVKEYVVSRDGVQLATVKGRKYRDTTADPGGQYEYVVESVLPADAGPDFPGRTWGFLVTVPHAEATDVAGLQDAAAELIVAAAANTETSVVNETFIPQAYISAPQTGCTYNGSSYSFKGDNRGYVANSAKYRTRLAAYINWSSGGAVSAYKSVSSTSVHRTSDKGLIATTTASSANMSLTRLAASTSTSADLRFIVNAQNPFCTSFGNAIEGAFTMTVKQAGTWSIISGSHRQMPNWEIYITRGGLAAPTWTTVYQRSYASVLCLVAIACTSANMSGRVGSY